MYWRLVRLAFVTSGLAFGQWVKYPTPGIPRTSDGKPNLSAPAPRTIDLGVIFYGYGFGLFGRIGSAAGALFGVIFYSVQLFWSQSWLGHYRFGPVEWLWRSLTYGERQPMLRPPPPRPSAPALHETACGNGDRG
jgi:hypothetical protein